MVVAQHTGLANYIMSGRSNSVCKACMGIQSRRAKLKSKLHLHESLTVGLSLLRSNVE